jgi:antitoxin (DNA-binding transcriptional repressor) of toxin-antitoxin stability system
MNALEAGEDFILTRNGRVVGEIHPPAPQRDLTAEELVHRFARFRGLIRSEDVRADVDAYFGEDRIGD